MTTGFTRSDDRQGGFPATLARPRRVGTALLLALVLLPVVSATIILSRQNLRVPYQDDFDAIVRYQIADVQLPSTSARLAHIFIDQHNEYKLVLLNVLMDADVAIEHHLNFELLTALGNYPLIPIGLMLWCIYARPRQDLQGKLMHLLPIALVFFSLTYWEALDWASCGLQWTPAILLALTSVYLLTREESGNRVDLKFLLACGAAVLATLSSSNAFLLAPVGLLYLLSRRAYPRAAVWSGVFALTLAVYLYHYVRYPPELGRYVYADRFLEFFCFLGDAVPWRWPAALLGLGIVVTTIDAARRGFHRVHPASSMIMLWCLGTAMAVAWVRGAAGWQVVSRYSFYSLLCLIFCFDYLTYRLSFQGREVQKRFYVAAVSAAAILCCGSQLAAIKHLGARRAMVLSGMEYYRCDPAVNSPMIDATIARYAPPEQAGELMRMNQAVRLGIYVLPTSRELGSTPGCPVPNGGMPKP